MPHESTEGIRCEADAAAIVAADDVAAKGSLGGRRILDTGSNRVVLDVSRSISSRAPWLGLSRGVSGEWELKGKGF